MYENESVIGKQITNLCVKNIYIKDNNSGGWFYFKRKSFLMQSVW